MCAQNKMPFFETPKLQDIVLEREFSNVCNDKISSNPSKNAKLLRLYRFLERHYAHIDTQMQVQESSFKSHMHVPPYTKNDTGYFRFYDSGSDKTVIVVPERGGILGYKGARLIASYLASNGFNVYEIVTPFREKRLPNGVISVVDLPIDVKTIKLAAKQAIEEIMGLIDLTRQRNVSLVGISQGAWYSSIVASLDSRVERVVLIHGFGDIASQLLYADERFAKHFRKENAEWQAIGQPYENLLRRELKDVDPLTYATSEKRERTLMINSRNDHALPEENIRALWEELGRPEIKWFYIPILDPHAYILLRSKKILKMTRKHLEK